MDYILQKVFKKFIIFRPHNVYGKDMGDDHVIPQFIKRFKKLGKRKQFLIFGTGKEIRSFIYIDDFIFDSVKFLKREKNQEIYNIGTNEKIKISNLALLIANIFKKKIILRKTQILEGSPNVRCPNIKKIKNFGFKQKHSFKRWNKKYLIKLMIISYSKPVTKCQISNSTKLRSLIFFRLFASSKYIKKNRIYNKRGNFFSSRIIILR